MMLFVPQLCGSSLSAGGIHTYVVPYLPGYFGVVVGHFFQSDDGIPPAPPPVCSLDSYQIPIVITRVCPHVRIFGAHEPTRSSLELSSS